MRRILLLSVLSFLIFGSSFAQDPIFNQFYNAPLMTNPALTGAYQGKWRAGVNFRDAWSLPLGGDSYRTTAATFDMRFKAFDRDFFSLGFNFLNDRAGADQFTINRFNLSGAYLKQLAGKYGGYDSYLSFGVQAGAAKHSFDARDLWFYDQFNTGTNSVDPGTNTAAAFTDNTNLYLNVNVGLLWYAVFDDKKSVYLGGSYFHANNPNISFQDNSEVTLDPRMLVHAGGELPLGKSMSLMPSAMYTTQGGYMQFSPGINLRYNNSYFRELSLRAGLWARFTNALDGRYLESYIPSIMFEYENWLIGLSYEINVSPITAVNNGRGGVELSVYYVESETDFRTKISCPKF